MQLGMPLESAKAIFEAAGYGGSKSWSIKTLPGTNMRMLTTSIANVTKNSDGGFDATQILSKQYTEFEATWIASAIFAGAYNDKAQLPLLNAELTKISVDGEAPVVVDRISVDPGDGEDVVILIGKGLDSSIGHLVYRDVPDGVSAELVLRPEEAVKLKRRLREAKDILQPYEKVPTRKEVTSVPVEVAVVPKAAPKEDVYSKLPPAIRERIYEVERRIKAKNPSAPTFQEFVDSGEDDGKPPSAEGIIMSLTLLTGVL